MKKATVSIIAAVGKNTRVIGRQNGLIWKLDGDLPRFKRLTDGHPIIMGRKTFESLPRGALPGRTNIVITRNGHGYRGVHTVSSIDQAIEVAAKENKEIFVIGGGEIYAQALPFTEKLYLTVVHSDEPGDTFFPDYSEFKTVISEEHHGDHTPPFHYVELVR
jgi:dihydrofolate reductase